MAPAIAIEDIVAAAERIAPWIRRTPMMSSSHLDRLAERSLFFKCENFQRTGSFKFRGASNAVLLLNEASARRGVVTHSSGNHAQALAKAAALRGITAHVVMPRDSAASKAAAVRAFGGNIVWCEPTLAARTATAAEVLKQTGGTLIPPYDHPAVIAGQGTIALELLEQTADLDALVVPIGGGGLMSGIATAMKARAPRVRIIGAEPSAAGDAAASKHADSRQPAFEQPTIADGLRTALGELTWPIIRERVDEVVTVTEDEIRRALHLVLERMKIVIEPSSAVGVAAVLGPLRSRSELKRVGVILCGGNIDLIRLPDLIRSTGDDLP
jgi:threonine dehydratase